MEVYKYKYNIHFCIHFPFLSYTVHFSRFSNWVTPHIQSHGAAHTVRNKHSLLSHYHIGRNLYLKVSIGVNTKL